MSRRLASWLSGLAAVMAAASAQASVVRVEVESRTPIEGGYERISGRYFGELDPDDPHNAIITDLRNAPRNARGRVEYSATFGLSRPTDPARASGVLIYDVPNRGNGQAEPDAAGHMHLVSGWQGDIPPGPLQRAVVPIAKGPRGAPLTGKVLIRFVDLQLPKGATSVPLVAGLNGGVPRPAPLTRDANKAGLRVKRSDADPGTPVAADRWSFGDCRAAPFPGGPELGLCLKDGYDPALAYELTYVAKDPPVLGVGFAAVRDLVDYLRGGEPGAAGSKLAAAPVRWTLGIGTSQAGNFLRSFVHLGFNASEGGRRVFDGINPRIAARHTPLDFRFAVPGGAADLYEPGSEGPLWWGRYDDKVRGLGPTSLLDRCTRSQTCPKVIETFGSTELWGLRMSPDLVGTDAKADIPLPANVRRYYFPGVTHGGGRGGFAVGEATPSGGTCVLRANPNPSSDTFRALTAALVEWVRSGKSPPPSRYPQMSRGDLVAPNAKAMGFPAIPGAPTPDGKLNPFLVYEFGSSFVARDLTGVMSQVPPRIVRTLPSLVPRVDADGNETSGVASVQHLVPLGTYLGWNVRRAGYYAGGGCGFQGGYIPFARTRAERLASGDPRPSLEERYGDHAGFVAKVRAAAASQVAAGFLLPDDAARLVREAEASAVLR